jgi:hypothetical protein
MWNARLVPAKTMQPKASLVILWATKKWGLQQRGSF